MTTILIILFVMFVFFVLYLIHLGARGEHFGRAAIETFVVYLISNMPILFLAWASLYSGESGDFDSLAMNMKSVLKGGDVFIYVSAILASVVWALMAYFKDTHRALTGAYLMALMIILPFSAFSFQQARLTVNVNQEVLDNSAILLYCISLMLWFGAVVYTRFIESYEPSKPSSSVLEQLRGDK